MAGNILTRTAKRMGVPLWGQLLIGALVFIFVALAWQVFYRLGKVESAVKALATQSPMHDLVKELLSQAKGAPGNTELAQKAVTLTETIIRSASKMKAPAPLGFFDETIKDLDSLRETNTEIPRLKVMLAEYRSSLNEATASSENKTVTVKPFAQQILVFRGTVLRWGGQQGIDMFSRPVPCFNLSISQMGLASGQQTLDCIKWDSVTFINMHVLYQGGPLQVKDAYFINCTFEFAPSVNSTSVAEDIARGLATFSIS